MTTTVKARGHDWSQAYLADGWGPETTNEQVTELCVLVLARFHKLSAEHGCGAYWIPQTSEVVGDVNEEMDPYVLDIWREDAIDAVWSAVIGESNDNELIEQVNAIFAGEEA